MYICIYVSEMSAMFAELTPRSNTMPYKLMIGDVDGTLHGCWCWCWCWCLCKKKRPYPFAHDKLAKKQFDMYLGSIHGVMSPTTKVIVYTLLLGLLVGIVFLILVYGAEVEL